MKWRTLAGTATSDVDFNADSGTLTISAGNTSGTISVYVYGDSIDEADESLFVELSNPVGAVFAGDRPVLRGAGIILDDDGIGSNLAIVVSNPIVVEGNAGTKLAHVDVLLSRPADTSITLPYQTLDGTAIAGRDYTAVSGGLTFLPGQTTGAVDVPIIGDTASEASQTFSLLFNPPSTVASGSNGAGAVITILDDDAALGRLPVISIGNAQRSEINGYMTFDVILSAAAPSGGVSVRWRTVAGTATADVDYNTDSGTLTIAPGATAGTISLYVYADTTDEFDETVFIELSNPVGAAFAGDATILRGTGTILDDDGLGSNTTISVNNTTIGEGNATSGRFMSFEVTLSRPSSSTIVVPYQTFDGTALAGQDYVASNGSLTFLPGQTVTAVNVPIIGDRAVEASETFGVAFFASSAGPSTPATSALGTIIDDDVPGTTVRGDLTGDNTAEILLQGNGAVVEWVMGAGQYKSGRVLTSGDAGFQVRGTGDFNADGTADVVLQKDGAVIDWIVKDGAYQSGNVITTGAAGYDVVGTGDFNGDGTSDILLQNGGTVVEWLMQNGRYQSGNVISTTAGAFRVVGTGDLNGDGTTDILLQNGGTIVDWIMKNGAFQSGNVLTTAATGFTVMGTGDFNGDKTSDVILQSGGTVVDWMMQGGLYATGNVLTTAATGFVVRNTGDYNGDGTSDVVLQGGGAVVDWIMQNGTYQSGNVLTTGAAGFTVV